jgi:hypothetical protein
LRSKQESLGLPQVPELSFVSYANFGRKVGSLGKKTLFEYHELTKHRMEIAEYCLKQLVANYDNDIAFLAGLTGFLVHVKAALDSLCQEINLYYGLEIGGRPDYFTDTEELTESRNMRALSKKNAKLSELVAQELGASNPWFATFMILHDSEGIHKQQSARVIPFGIVPHDIEVGDKKVAEFCVESYSQLNRVTEEAYSLMT